MDREKNSNLRLFRKQLIFWGGLAAIALAFFVYGAWGRLPFPGDFTRSHLRSLLRPGSTGQLIVSATLFLSLLFALESWFALRFISRRKPTAGYMAGFSCEILPHETPFEREGPARSLFFITGIYGRSFLLSSPLHGDVNGVIGRDAYKLLPSGRYAVAIYEKRYACHPKIPGWPLCMFLPAGGRSGTAPLSEDFRGEYALLEGELDELWFLCLDRFPFAFPHRLRERRARKQWPDQVADLDTAVTQAQARSADTGKPVVVARKITTLSMYLDNEVENQTR
jgi:hypothetical protein